MGNTFVQGLAVLIAGLVALVLNNFLNLGLGSIAFGLLIGAVLGLVSRENGGPVGRVGAFIIGIIVAMVVYIVRVLLLNPSFAGEVLALIVGLGLLTLICGLTSGRLPLWAALLGTALVVGAYETSFVDAPQNVTSELFQYATMALVPAALGYLATVLLQSRVAEAEPPIDRDDNRPFNDPPRTDTDPTRTDFPYSEPAGTDPTKADFPYTAPAGTDPTKADFPYTDPRTGATNTMTKNSEV